MGCADFLVADSNAAAAGWLRRWPLWPTPTLIIHGTADKTVPIDATARVLNKALPHARLLEYDGAPHGLFASHKERFTADLLNFLREGDENKFTYAAQGANGLMEGARPLA